MKKIHGDIEQLAWNRQYMEKANNVLDERLSRKLNKREILDNLTASYNFEDKNILDIGTGDGEYILHIAREHPVKKFIAVDFSEQAIKVSEGKRKRLGLTNCIFIVADAHHLPFKKDSFDIVTIINVLHHLLLPRKVLQETYSLAKRFILVEKNRLNPYEWLCLVRRKAKYPSDPSFFVWEIKHLIKDSGFDIEKIKYSQLVPYTIYNFRILKKFFWRDAFIKWLLHISHFLQQTPILRCFGLVVMAKGKRFKKIAVTIKKKINT